MLTFMKTQTLRHEVRKRDLDECNLQSKCFSEKMLVDSSSKENLNDTRVQLIDDAKPCNGGSSCLKLLDIDSSIEMEVNSKNDLSSTEQSDILSALTTTENLASNPDLTFIISNSTSTEGMA